MRESSHRQIANVGITFIGVTVSLNAITVKSLMWELHLSVIPLSLKSIIDKLLMLEIDTVVFESYHQQITNVGYLYRWSLKSMINKSLMLKLIPLSLKATIDKSLMLEIDTVVSQSYHRRNAYVEIAFINDTVVSVSFIEKLLTFEVHLFAIQFTFKAINGQIAVVGP